MLLLGLREKKERVLTNYTLAGFPNEYENQH